MQLVQQAPAHRELALTTRPHTKPARRARHSALQACAAALNLRLPGWAPGPSRHQASSICAHRTAAGGSARGGVGRGGWGGGSGLALREGAIEFQTQTTARARPEPSVAHRARPVRAARGRRRRGCSGARARGHHRGGGRARAGAQRRHNRRTRKLGLALPGSARSPGRSRPRHVAIQPAEGVQMRRPGVREDEGIPTLAGPGEQWGHRGPWCGCITIGRARSPSAERAEGQGHRACSPWWESSTAYITEIAGASTWPAAPRAQSARNSPTGRGFGRTVGERPGGESLLLARLLTPSGCPESLLVVAFSSDFSF